MTPYSLLFKPLNQHDPDTKLSDFWQNNTRNLNNLSVVIPEDIFQTFTNTFTPNPKATIDELIWDITGNGLFSSKKGLHSYC